MRVAVTMLVFCVAALMALGLVMLYSSSTDYTDASQLMLKQSIWCVLGVVMAIVAATLDYRWLRRAAVPLLAFSVVLLALVLEPHIGKSINGARRWFAIGSVSLQPSELAKLALVLALAWYGDRYQRQMPSFKKGIFIPGLFIGMVLTLVFVEPDRGTAILLAAVSGAMLLIAGVQWRYFVPPVLLGAVGLAVSIWHDPMRLRRVTAWLYPEEHRSGAGYQGYQSILALGSGGVQGLGLGNSRQKFAVPEHPTDFILSIIGEELGLIATLLIVVAFMIILCCGIYISLRSGSVFGLLLGSGLTFLIGLQAFINIGVVTSTLPNKGLPLPFISYGGSNLLAMLTAVGLLLSIARRARAPEEGLVGSDFEPAPAGQPA